MAHSSSGFRAGAASFAKFLGINALPLISSNPLPPVGRGAFMSPAFVYTVIPLTLQTNNIAASQTPGAAGNLTLTAGTGVTSGTVQGATVMVLDCARAVKISSTVSDVARTFTVTGYDIWNQFQTEAITGPATNVTGKKTWSSILNIAVDAATAGAITVGTSDVFGVPYVFSDKGLITVRWNNTLADDASTLVVADATSPATTTTGDVRGTVTPSANASNGTRRLIVTIQIIDPDTQAGLYGVTPV